MGFYMSGRCRISTRRLVKRLLFSNFKRFWAAMRIHRYLVLILLISQQQSSDKDCGRVVSVNRRGHSAG